MAPMPDRSAQPQGGQPPADQQGGESLDFLSQQQQEQPPEALAPQEALKGKLQLFRSTDEMVMNLLRTSPTGAKYGKAIQDILKKWMMDEVASTRSRPENPKILGA